VFHRSIDRRSSYDGWRSTRTAVEQKVHEGRDWLGSGGRHLSDQSAAVHRHSLDRLNTINDFLIKKKQKDHHLIWQSQ